MTDMDNNVNQQPVPDQEPQVPVNEAPQAPAASAPTGETPQAPVNPAPQVPVNEIPQQPVPPVYPQQPPQPKDRRGMAIASLILGIASIVLCCLWYLSIICAVVGIVLGIMSLKSSGHGMALAGIICGSVGLVLCIVMLILGAIGLSNYYLNEYRYGNPFDY